MMWTSVKRLLVSGTMATVVGTAAAALAGHRTNCEKAEQYIQCLLSPCRCSPCPKHPECPQRCNDDCCHKPLPQPKAVEPCFESDPCCCSRSERVSAAHHLGMFDACCCPQVVPALTHALMCDPAWQVRATAARALRWSQPLGGHYDRCDCQRAEVVAALRVAEKLDPNWIVRSEAKDARGVLCACNKCCCDEIDKKADAIAAELKPLYKPGGPDCHAALAKWLELSRKLHDGHAPAPGSSAPAPATTKAGY